MSQTLLLHGQICVLPGRRKALSKTRHGWGRDDAGERGSSATGTETMEENPRHIFEEDSVHRNVTWWKRRKYFA